MKSINKVFLLGNAGKNPESRVTGGGTLVTTLSLATNERIKRGDKWEERVEWHAITFFGRLAEIARDYVRKGSNLHVEGRLRTRKWDDNGTTRYSTGIIAEDVTLLDGPRDGQQQSSRGGRAVDPVDAETARYVNAQPDDDIPF